MDTVDAVHDPIRRPLSVKGFEFMHEAEEWFALAPNGMWRVALFDAAGKRQDAVPPDIATDAIAVAQHATDAQVVPMVSCFRCHDDGGLQSFVDQQTRILRGHVDLKAYSYEDIKRIKDFYNEPRLKRQMEFDRGTFTAAVFESTGWTTEEAAGNFSVFIREYAYKPVRYGQAQLELGIPRDVPLRTILIPGAPTDPHLLDVAQGETTPRGLWEGAFAEAITFAERSRR